MKQDLLRQLPKVDEILREEKIKRLFETVPYALVIETIREVLEELRREILKGEEEGSAKVELFSITEEIGDRITKRERGSMPYVINATGIPLHTNLGRAPLCRAAVDAVCLAAEHYCALEFDLTTGKRGAREEALEQMISKLTGAESAMVVNNNAAATMLCLSTLSRDREVLLSRGELVEIGGSFRIPEIMAQSGCRLVEVGTTNRTRIADYEREITEETAVLLKVHTSNYRIVGFTEAASLGELRALGDKYGLPVVYDMGSGLMVNLRDYGIEEPTVQEALREGADVVLFSGDKLLGGPQSGVLAGKKAYIERMKKHPLARAFRAGKMTIAGLTATLREYYDKEKGKENIPALRAIMTTREELLRRGEAFLQRLKAEAPGISARVCLSENTVGGGSAPEAVLPSAAVEISCSGISAETMAERLRQGKIPVIARIHRGKIRIELRTVAIEEEETLLHRLVQAAEL